MGLAIGLVIGGQNGVRHEVRAGDDIGEGYPEGRAGVPLARAGYISSYCSSALRGLGGINWVRPNDEQSGATDACDEDGTVATQEGAGLADVLPSTLADLQAQGRTPTRGATEPNTWEEPEDAWALDPLLTIIQAPLEPEYGSLGRTAELICAYPWPQGCDHWIGIAQCESILGQDPDAYADWNPFVGLFQIWEEHGYGREWLKDSANNTLAAWELSDGGTYTGAWPACQ